MGVKGRALRALPPGPARLLSHITSCGQLKQYVLGVHFKIVSPTLWVQCYFPCNRLLSAGKLLELPHVRKSVELFCILGIWQTASLGNKVFMGNKIFRERKGGERNRETFLLILKAYLVLTLHPNCSAASKGAPDFWTLNFFLMMLAVIHMSKDNEIKFLNVFKSL